MKIRHRILSLFLVAVRGVLVAMLAGPALLAIGLKWVGKFGEILDEWLEDLSYELIMSTKPQAWERYKAALREAKEEKSRADWAFKSLEAERADRAIHESK